MAINEGPRRETEALRQIPLGVVIMSVWPDSTAEKQGGEVTQWKTPVGKINVRPEPGQSDLYKFWSGPFAGKGNAGALNFLIDSQVFHGFPEARRYLMHLDPSRIQIAVNERKQAVTTTQSQGHAQEFRLPMRVFDPQKNLQRVTDYLVSERKLPKELIESLASHRHPPFYAGFGSKYDDYIVFPCRDHSKSPATSAPSASLPPPTGAILRWRHTDRTPPADQFGGRTSPMSAGSQKSAGWWQIGQGRQVLIVTEAPVDGLTVASALLDTREYAAQSSFLATGGTGGLNAWQFVGYDTIMVATDADREGDQIAQEAQAMSQPGQTVIRVRPPMGHKDWNAAWQADSESVKRTWHEAFQGLERGQEMER